MQSIVMGINEGKSNCSTSFEPILRISSIEIYKFDLNKVRFTNKNIRIKLSYYEIHF